MRRLLVRKIITPQVCTIATQAFVNNIGEVEEALQTAINQRPELIRHGRRLFETEVLEDLPSAYSWEVARKICQMATQLRISPVKSPLYSKVVEMSMDATAVSSTDLYALARVIHSCLVLCSPLLYEVLFTFIPLLIKQASIMNALSIAIVINAYGRAEVHHPALFQALCDSAANTLKSPQIQLPHIANVAHALSRVHFFHRPLMLVLRDQASRMGKDAQPLVMVTLLDAFVELGFIDEEVFSAYESRLLDNLKDIQPPLIASLLDCLATAGRATPKLLETVEKYIIEQSNAFNSVSISMTFHALFKANVLLEEAFGVLAERACKLPADFRPEEIYHTLNALSSFDLFDGELFPLLASRFMTLMKQGDYVGVEEAAGILASFAAVQERHDELIHGCTQLFVAHLGSAMRPSALVNALWACAIFNIRNEAQMKLLEEARKNPRLLDLQFAPKGKLCERENIILKERYDHVLRVYGIDSSEHIVS
ncbi:unnamed protein product [Phytomonas sp. EM1]|nr:unnamed protein product [Phytomonas sp. EM1]|eukprot:CCW59931.1 unnamed protein product [Phytomonas sp. isolate EM1]